YGNVGNYTITPSGLTADDYNIEYLSGTLDVQPKEAVLNWSNTSLTYTGTAQKPVATAIGLVNGDSCDVTVTGEKIDAGTYTATASGLSNSNYRLPENKTTEFTIAKADSSITASPNGKEGLVYDGTAKALINAGEATGGTLKYSLNNTSFDTAIPNGTGAGSYTVYYKVFGDSNHYDSDVQSLTVSIGKASYGNKTETASEKYGKSGEKDLSSLIVQGGSLSGCSFTDANNVLNGSPSVTGSKLGFAFKNNSANKDKTAKVTVNVKGGSNYEDYTIEVTLTVLDKYIQTLAFSGITDGKLTKVYGDADYTKTVQVTQGDGSVTYSGNNDGVATVEASTGKVHIKKTGTVTITATAAETGDYATASTSYTLTVSKKKIGLDWGSTSHTYDKQEFVPSATATGLVNSDTCTVTVSGGQTNAGTYTATATAVDNTDYELPDAVTKSFTISKRPVGVSGITASNKQYNGTVAATLSYNNVVFTGLIAGDDLSVAGQGAFSNANAGEDKTVNITGLTLGGSSVGNYELSSIGIQQTTTASISKRQATVTANSQTVVLGGSIISSTAQAQLSGALQGHELSQIVLTGSNTSHVTVSGTITPSGAKIKSGSTDVTANYDISYETGVLTVTKGTPNVTAPQAKQLTYNGQAQQLVNAGSSTVGTTMEYSLSEAGEYSTTLPTGTNAGSYTVWYKVEGGADYEDVVPQSIEASIGRADIANAEVTLGEALTYTGSTLTQTVNKVMLGTLEVTSNEYLLAENTATNAGNYNLRITAKDDGNYKGYLLKPFSIAKKSITPSIVITGSYTYTGSAIVPEFSVKDGDAILTATDYTYTITNNTNAGTATVTVVASNGNYSFDQTSQTFTIAKAAHQDQNVAISSVFGSSVTRDLSEYIASGGQPGNLNVSESESVFDGTPTLSGNKLNFSLKNVSGNTGKKAIVTFTVDGADNYENYNIQVVVTVINCAHIHTEYRNVRAATCTEQGYSGDLYCLDCGMLVEQGSSTPIDPDNHAYDNGVVIKEPTGLTEGEMKYTCIRCGHTKIVAIPRKETDNNYESELLEDTKGLSGNNAPKVSTSTNSAGNKEKTVTIGGIEVLKEVTNSANGAVSTESKVWIGGLDSTYHYTSSAIKPEIHVYDGTTVLTQNEDYTVSYKNNKNPGTATVTVKFKGNYLKQNNVSTTFTIVPAVLGEDIVASEVGVAVSKKEQKPVPVFSWVATGKTVSKKFFKITYDRTVKEAGTYTATITAANTNYTGSTTAKIKVVGDKNLLLSKAKVKFNPGSYAYTGEEIIPGSDAYTLKIGKNELTVGQDYKITGIYNNVSPGKATVVFEAVSTNSAGYVGSKTATFKITGSRKLTDSSPFSYSYSSSVAYLKDGAKPEVIVYDGTTRLKQGTDYTVSYSKNTAVTNGSTTAVIKVKGKKNYKGTVQLYFDIVQQDLGNLSSNMIATDQFTTKNKLKKPSVTIRDMDDTKLALNKDYVFESDLTYTGDENSGQGTVTVTGKGNYKGSAKVTFRYLDKSFNLSKAKVKKKIADQNYTGNEIELTNSDLTGVLTTVRNKSTITLVPGTDFVIAGYLNNTKKGTAKVILKGTGSYAGVKTVTFKIVQKNVNYTGALVGGSWQ
nr:hypothetical protein [Lachnospiraceae bacterium]